MILCPQPKLGTLSKLQALSEVSGDGSRAVPNGIHGALQFSSRNSEVITPPVHLVGLHHRDTRGVLRTSFRLIVTHSLYSEHGPHAL